MGPFSDDGLMVMVMFFVIVAGNSELSPCRSMLGVSKSISVGLPIFLRGFVWCLHKVAPHKLKATVRSPAV